MAYSPDFDKSLSLNNDWLCPTELLMGFMENGRKLIIRVEGIKNPLSLLFQNNPNFIITIK